jgi:hypothetical protein
MLASEAPVCSKTYWWFLMGRKVVSGFEEERERVQGWMRYVVRFWREWIDYRDIRYWLSARPDEIRLQLKYHV